MAWTPGDSKPSGLPRTSAPRRKNKRLISRGVCTRPCLEAFPSGKIASISLKSCLPQLARSLQQQTVIPSRPPSSAAELLHLPGRTRDDYTKEISNCRICAGSFSYFSWPSTLQCALQPRITCPKCPAKCARDFPLQGPLHRLHLHSRLRRRQHCRRRRCGTGSSTKNSRPSWERWEERKRCASLRAN